MEKKYKLYKCKLCNKPIEDEQLIAISRIKQTFNTVGTTHHRFMENLDIGWEKLISSFYHVGCIEEIAGEEFIKENTDNPLLNPNDNPEFISRIQKLAGV